MKPIAKHINTAESQTSDLSISSLTLYPRATVLLLLKRLNPFWTLLKYANFMRGSSKSVLSEGVQLLQSFFFISFFLVDDLRRRIHIPIYAGHHWHPFSWRADDIWCIAGVPMMAQH